MNSLAQIQLKRVQEVWACLIYHGIVHKGARRSNACNSLAL